MAKVGITLFLDHHFGIIRNQFSLTELLRSNIKVNGFTISYRHVVSKNISTMCNLYPSKLEEIKSFSKDNDKNIYVIGLGASDYKSGYNYKMFEEHIKGLIKEINILSEKPFEIVFLNFDVNNKLRGSFLKNYKRMSKIITDIASSNNSYLLISDIKFLFLNNGDYVVSTNSIPMLVENISETITNILTLE